MPSLPLAADDSTLISRTPVNYQSADDLPLLQEWAYDFETNQFKTDKDGKYYLVSGNEALKIWIFWAVTTAKNRWRANSVDYGSEIERMIGLDVTTAIKNSELQRTVKESIEICQYIKEIRSIETSLGEDELVTVTVKLKSIYNEGWEQISVKV